MFDNEDQPYEERMPEPQYEQGGDYSEADTDAYELTAADQALYSHMRLTELGGLILQSHVDGELSRDTYNKLYAVYDQARIAAARLQQRLENEQHKKPQNIAPGLLSFLWNDNKLIVKTGEQQYTVSADSAYELLALLYTQQDNILAAARPMTERHNAQDARIQGLLSLPGQEHGEVKPE